jgi:hypothetical protein
MMNYIYSKWCHDTNVQISYDFSDKKWRRNGITVPLIQFLLYRREHIADPDFQKAQRDWYEMEGRSRGRTVTRKNTKAKVKSKVKRQIKF